MSRSSQMIFSPGMALLIIPTDKTPRLSRKEIRRREQQMDDWVRESYGLENQYVTALGTGYVAPALLAVLRRIYHDEVSDALTLFRRNVEESGDPQSAILNPVVALRMERVTALVESLSAVGYYYTSGNGGEFIRFTQV